MDNWQTFVAWIVGILVVGASITALIDGGFDAAEREDELRKLKIQACQTVEEQSGRALCIHRA